MGAICSAPRLGRELPTDRMPDGKIPSDEVPAAQDAIETPTVPEMLE